MFHEKIVITVKIRNILRFYEFLMKYKALLSCFVSNVLILTSAQLDPQFLVQTFHK